MRALVIVHEPGCEPVLVGERLRQRGFELDEIVVAARAGDPSGRAEFGEPSDHDLVVAMGSICSVNDASTLGWINDELDFLRRTDAADVPILGICFGAQALATALGGRVVRADRHQIGWLPCDPDVDCGLPSGPWMQWHYDRIEVPPGARVLASDDVCVQAYTVGRNLGVQFHPEVTRAHLQRWLDDGGAAELAELEIDADVMLAEADAIEPDASARADRLVDWFLTDVAKL